MTLVRVRGPEQCTNAATLPVYGQVGWGALALVEPLDVPPRLIFSADAGVLAMGSVITLLLAVRAWRWVISVLT